MPKIAAMSPEEIRILRAMTPAQKLKAMERLYWTARSLKAAWLRSQHPDWSEEEVQQKVREIFMKAAGCANPKSGCCSRGVERSREGVASAARFPL